MIELGFLMVDWRQIFRVSLAVLAFAGATSSHAQAHGDGFSFEATARVKHVDWMKSVPGSVRLSAMSIPGTEQSLHDGPEKNGVRHQSMTLQNQLEAGIRAVDFRTVMVNGRLAVYNGQATHSLDDALDTLRNYLAAYPSEMIFVRLAAQPDDLIFVHAGPRLKRALPPASAEHARVFAQYLQNTRWSEYFWSIGTRDPMIPTLDAVRGKIVFILGSGYQSLPTGYTEEKKDGSRMTAYRNEVVNSSVSFYEKWQHVQNSFIDVRSAWPDGQFFTTSLEGSGGLWAASITFTPGFVASGRPTEASNKAPSLMGFGPITNHPFPDFPIGECVGLDDCAISYEGINQLAVNDLRQVSPVSAGIVTAAFPGTGLIETLIGLNKPRLTGEQIRFSPRQGQFQCVTAPRPGAANVAMVETCDDGDPLQRWLMGKDGLIRTALDANRCLKSDIEALKQGATHLFTTFISIRLASCLEPASERWIRQANGEITVATSPDKCLVSSTGTGNTSRAAAIACTWVPAESRRWTVQSPAMPIVSGHDQCLQVDAQAVVDGSHPFIATCAADAGAMAVQAWSMQPDFSVRTAAAKDLCLHAETAAIGLKSSMTLRRCDGGLRQKWALRPDGSFRPLANENL
ncbi:MAG: Phosphatidylinositol-specific phospholipase, partial [Rhizobacter sp.]|nr:Phosphatidylinositol-specific phospholipase [Rhizobacter sp.]